MIGARLPYRYDHYTWPEIRDLVEKQPVVILPVGSTEDHGHHLPLDVDTFVVSSICDAAAQQIPDEVLLLPEVAYGFEDHHMDFPGTITIRDESFAQLCGRYHQERRPPRLSQDPYRQRSRLQCPYLGASSAPDGDRDRCTLRYAQRGGWCFS